MVQVSPDREVYTERVVEESSSSTAMIAMFSILIIAVLGFMVYYFSNTNMTNSGTQNTIIERSDTTTHTTTPVPVQVPVATPTPEPAPSAPASEPATP